MHAIFAGLLNHLGAVIGSTSGTGLGMAIAVYAVKRAEARVKKAANEAIDALETHLEHSAHPQDAVAIHAIAACIACRLPDDALFAKDGAALLVSKAPRLKHFQSEIEEGLKVILDAVKADFNRMSAQNATALGAGAQPLNDVPHS